MTKKKVNMLLSAYAMAAAMGTPMPEILSTKTKRQKVGKIIPNGCKEYTIDGITVVAISEKSAKKKVRKLKKNNK